MFWTSLLHLMVQFWYPKVDKLRAKCSYPSSIFVQINILVRIDLMELVVRLWLNNNPFITQLHPDWEYKATRGGLCSFILTSLQKCLITMFNGISLELWLSNDFNPILLYIPKHPKPRVNHPLTDAQLAPDMLYRSESSCDNWQSDLVLWLSPCEGVRWCHSLVSMQGCQ